PQEATCMGCHLTVKADSAAMMNLVQEPDIVPRVKVYRLPDYVWFSHEVHHREAGLECEGCHGPVAEREVIAREKSISMNSCIACHDRRGASKECNVCHDMR